MTEDATRSWDELRAEAATIGGETLFVNRFTIQRYDNGGLRVSFAEQFSHSSEQPPAFRTAVYLSPESAAEFIEMLKGT